MCRDVLSIEPENQQALVTLLLALTDEFAKGYAVGITQAQEVLSLLHDPYRGRTTPHYVRAARKSPTPAGTPRFRPRCIRVTPRSNDLVRKGRGASPRKERRFSVALELLCSPYYGKSTHSEAGRESRAVVGVAGTVKSHERLSSRCVLRRDRVVVRTLGERNRTGKRATSATVPCTKHTKAENHCRHYAGSAIQYPSIGRYLERNQC